MSCHHNLCHSNVKITPISPPVDVLGESAHWETKKESLLWVDIQGRKVNRHTPSTGQFGSSATQEPVSFAIPRSNGQGLLIAQNTRLDFLDEATGAQTPFITAESLGLAEGLVTNDGKCDSRGRVWFGVWNSNYTLETLPPTGALYSVLPNKVVKLHAGGFKLPNGMGWTSDNRTMLMADTVNNCIFAFDFEVESGSVCRQRKALDFFGSSLPGFPDGLTLDRDDKLWLAFFLGSRLEQYDLVTGKRLQTLDFSPTVAVTDPHFGGRHFEDLYVTTANGMLTEEQKKQQPNAGSVYKVTGLQAKGRAPNDFAG